MAFCHFIFVIGPARIWNNRGPIAPRGKSSTAGHYKNSCKVAGVDVLGCGEYRVVAW